MGLFKPKVVSVQQMNCPCLEDDFKIRAARLLCSDIISMAEAAQQDEKKYLNDLENRHLENAISQAQELGKNDVVVQSFIKAKFEKQNPVLIKIYSNGKQEADCPYKFLEHEKHRSGKPYHASTSCYYCRLKFIRSGGFGGLAADFFKNDMPTISRSKYFIEFIGNIWTFEAHKIRYNEPTYYGRGDLLKLKHQCSLDDRIFYLKTLKWW